MRQVDFAGKKHRAIAVRDLRGAQQRGASTSAFSPITNFAHRAAQPQQCFNKRLDQEIELAMSSSGKLAILCLDIDRFKEVNDLFGHAAGDKMLPIRRRADRQHAR